jgi:hypothetical protein
MMGIAPSKGIIKLTGLETSQRAISSSPKEETSGQPGICTPVAPTNRAQVIVIDNP